MEEEAPELSPTFSPPSRTIVTPNQFIEPELLYGVCEYLQISYKPLAVLTALENSVRVQPATSGELWDARPFPRQILSSLWEICTVAYSGIKLAATPEADGKIKYRADRANC
jgi:hypothetical protein